MQPSHRRQMLANLACSVLEHGRIKTTEARAKEVKPVVEKMITMGKAGDLNSRRTAIGQLRNKQISYKLFNEIAPRYADRQGGYTRITHLGPRPGDSAEMVYLELV
jgi:large subunit ribosomal protein L17